MIEQALYTHLLEQASLAPFLAEYDGRPAIFNQEAPADVDELWGDGPQYGRIVFAVDLQGDPERTMGGTLAVDIMCKESEQFPEDIEPVIKELIHGYFFSRDAFTVSAQWKNTSYFTQPEDHVTGCTVAFELLAFPILTTMEPDVVRRINEWSAALPNIHVINHDHLPDTAWKPEGDETAIYWRCGPEAPAGWIPDTFQTIWRKTTVKGHIFSKDMATMATVARDIVYRLYAAKRLMKDGEAPIMVNQRNNIDYGADALRSGQVTVEATFGVIVHIEPDPGLLRIHYE